MVGKNRRYQREMCEDQFRDILQKGTPSSLNGLSRSALPLASLVSFCTHPLPRVPTGPPSSAQNSTPSPMPYMGQRGEASQTPVYWWAVVFAGIYSRAGVSVTQGHVNNYRGALGFPLFPNRSLSSPH